MEKVKDILMSIITIIVVAIIVAITLGVLLLIGGLVWLGALTIWESILY